MRIAFVCKVCFDVSWDNGIRDPNIWSPNHRQWHTCKKCEALGELA